MARVALFFCGLLREGLGLLLGLPLPLLFWGGLAVPFVAAGLAALHFTRLCFTGSAQQRVGTL
jgi:hypothetical protein